MPHTKDTNTKAPKRRALAVQVEAAQGHAAPYNTMPAHVLVVATDPRTGKAVTGLSQDDFVVINHFSIPGQTCGFSNNIVSFSDVMTGAYHVEIGLSDDIAGCTWVYGDYLMQVIITAGSRTGQGTATLRVR